jgi:hypothetical protein
LHTCLFLYLSLIAFSAKSNNFYYFQGNAYDTTVFVSDLRRASDSLRDFSRQRISEQNLKPVVQICGRPVQAGRVCQRSA